MFGKNGMSVSLRMGMAAAILGLVAAAVPAIAGGGNVLPSNAKPKGYSLTDAAAATAVFNTGPHDATPPKLPFYTLTNDATVRPGTTLYVPVFYADDSGVVEGVFPGDVTDQQAAADYLMGLVKNDFNVDALFIVVDGQITVLDDSNIVGPYLASKYGISSTYEAPEPSCIFSLLPAALLMRRRAHRKADVAQTTNRI